MNKLNLHADMLVGDAKLIQLLGTGESGEVWSALTNNGKIAALKIYKGEDEVKTKAEYEYNMACSFKHENIIEPSAISSYDSHPIITLPYCEGRSVDGIAAHFSEGMIWKLIQNISSALSEIHQSGYAHLDVKPSNILWDGQKFILSDFGACTKLDIINPSDTATDTSSYKFDAPELNNQPHSASDIWSLGATVFYLYMGCYVFNGLGGRAQHNDSPLPYMRKSLPALSKQVQECLSYNHTQRPTAAQIFKTAVEECRRLETIPIARSIRQEINKNTKSSNADFWSDDMIETLK